MPFFVSCIRHCAAHTVMRMTCTTASAAESVSASADLLTKPIGLNRKPSCRLPVNYTNHRHFIITQPKSWYSFYHATEGSRLSRPSWLATYRDFTRSQTVTHPMPSNNRARRRVTTLIQTNALPLSHATNLITATNVYCTLPLYCHRLVCG